MMEQTGGAPPPGILIDLLNGLGGLGGLERVVVVVVSVAGLCGGNKLGGEKDFICCLRGREAGSRSWG